MAPHHDIDHVQQAADREVEQKLGVSAVLDAKQATEDEHNQKLWQALRENRKAVMWSVLISMTIVMEGYDTILMGNFFAYPTFREKFGVYFGPEKGYQVTAPWQTGLSMSSTVGTIIGGLFNGYMATKYGYRWVMIGALGFLNAAIFIVFFAPNASTLIGGQITCGLSWGVFATLAPAYASEVCPTNLRGYLTTYVNLCWAMGQFIAQGVLTGCLPIPGDMGWRIPFALQWLWPLPLMVVCFIAPESPWWLVRNNKLDRAKKSLERLAGDKSTEDINNTLAMMVHTTGIESETHTSASYLDCFKGSNLRRTEIVCLTFMGQILSGSSFAYTPTYFFTSAGMPTSESFKLGLGAKAAAFIGTVLSWWLITYFGRRPLYVGGMGILATILLIIGILDVSTKSTALWPSGGLCVVWLFTYSLTLGPLAVRAPSHQLAFDLSTANTPQYSIVSETSSIRLRPLSVVLARVSYQLINIVSQVLQAYTVNPSAWDLKGRTGFLWGATATAMFIWSFFRLPEIKGRTYEELDILFLQGVPARKFSSTHVDPYAHAVVTEKVGNEAVAVEDAAAATGEKKTYA